MSADADDASVRMQMRHPPSVWPTREAFFCQCLELCLYYEEARYILSVSDGNISKNLLLYEAVRWCFFTETKKYCDSGASLAWRDGGVAYSAIAHAWHNIMYHKTDRLDDALQILEYFMVERNIPISIDMGCCPDAAKPLVSRMRTREKRCRAACVILLHRRKALLPRDVARIISEMVWSTRRQPVWQPSPECTAK